MQINTEFGCIHSTTCLSLKKVNSQKLPFRWNLCVPAAFCVDELRDSEALLLAADRH
jgi:hypothetical protein